MGLRSPYVSSLPASSSPLQSALFSASMVGPLASLESFGGRAAGEASTQALDAVDLYSSGAGMGTGMGAAGGLDSLSEFTMPGQ